MPRKKPSEKLEVLTPNQYSKGQGWLSVNAPADRHKLNTVEKANRPNMINVCGLTVAILSDNSLGRPAYS